MGAVMLKKFLVMAGIVAVAAALTAGVVFAQTPTPPDPASAGYGPDRFGSGGPMMGGYGRGRLGALQPGWMNDAVLDAFARALDMERGELEARLAAGETIFQIATAEGLTRDEFLAVMAEARAAALAQAVEDGTLTQAQADAMAAHMGRRQGRMANGAGQGNCLTHPAAPAP